MMIVRPSGSGAGIQPFIYGGSRTAGPPVILTDHNVELKLLLAMSGWHKQSTESGDSQFRDRTSNVDIISFQHPAEAPTVSSGMDVQTLISTDPNNPITTYSYPANNVLEHNGYKQEDQQPGTNFSNCVGFLVMGYVGEFPSGLNVAIATEAHEKIEQSTWSIVLSLGLPVGAEVFAYGYSFVSFTTVDSSIDTKINGVTWHIDSGNRAVNTYSQVSYDGSPLFTLSAGDLQITANSIDEARVPTSAAIAFYR